tara:strand:+ start:2972 stop:3613 length:642 start_codon:yes stop_codon:yes gene_type:complete
MSEKFWFQHPNELIKDFDFWPREGMRFEEKLNAISRLVIILSCLGYIYTKNTQIFVVGLTTLGVIIFLYQQKKTIHETEGFAMPNETTNSFYRPSAKNPLSNVLLTEIHDDPNRNIAPPAFAPEVHKNINKDVQQMVQDQHPDFPDMKDKLFKDLGDSVEFHNSMIPFNSNPATQIPNDQNAFAKFCYGDMPSCKAGDDVACLQNTASYLPEN